MGSRTFKADLGQLEEALAFIESLASGRLDGERATDLLVAAEEAFTNVAKHAYDGEGEIEVSVEADQGIVRLTLADRGRPFDPLGAPPPDLNEEVEDRRIGGLGIHLMRNLADDMRYRREGGKNILTMIVSTSDRDIPTI
jgi:serine/threonine-protein kinase RsbW